MNKYIVTLKNFDGECKRVRVTSTSPEQAMADAQGRGWYPVDVMFVTTWGG